ncbi:MAG: hypothetical protein M3256_03550 [Actinomycetota bacterium]|nr:hypothetical protein [Actinomycetota bacterium]
MRVIEDASIYARLTVESSDLRVTLESRAGGQIAETTWRSSQTAADIMQEIADLLRKASLYPGEHFDPGLMFAGFSDLLGTAVELRRRFSLIEDLSGAIELCAPQWLVCDWGIAGYPEDRLQPYPIPAERLEEADWYRHMAEKTWLDEQSFRYALETARALKAAGRIRG